MEGEGPTSRPGAGGQATLPTTRPRANIPILPASPASGGSPEAATTPPPSKRRRALGTIIANACTGCRRKRTKCDGQQPCSRCKPHGAECIYEVSARQSKEALRSEIEQLRRRLRSADAVVDGPEEATPQRKNDEGTEDNAGRMTTTAHRLRVLLPTPPLQPIDTGSDPLPGSVPSCSPHPSRLFEPQAIAEINPSLIGNLSIQSQGSPAWDTAQASIRSGRSEEIVLRDASTLGSLSEMLVAPSPHSEKESHISTWTCITSDTDLIEHLLALYFCWEYPTFATISKEHFLEDFYRGRRRYCSEMLVNAILALGCRFSVRSVALANLNEPYTSGDSGDRFFQESRRLLRAEEDYHTLTTVQTLGIMSIREACSGRSSDSSYYAAQSIRLAVEMGLHLTEEARDADRTEIQLATFWGAFALDHAWSLAIGSLPQYSWKPVLPLKPTIIHNVEDALWTLHTDDGIIPQQTYEQPSHVRSVFQCFCELSELAHESSYLLYSPETTLTSHALLDVYIKYLHWYNLLPDVLRLGKNFTPSVFFAHMYYHYGILLLFRPFIKLGIGGSGVSPRDVCLQAADTLSALLQSYSQLYTLQRTPAFVPYFVLTSTTVHLAIGPRDPRRLHTGSHVQSGTRNDIAPSSDAERHVPSAIEQSIACLVEMAPYHPFAGKALHILRSLAKQWNSGVDFDVAKASIDEMTRRQVGLPRPYTHGGDCFMPNGIGGGFSWAGSDSTDDLVEAISRLIVGEPASEDALFWPFARQGQPKLLVEHLEEAGFYKLP